jgi:hypothetical protein
LVSTLNCKFSWSWSCWIWSRYSSNALIGKLFQRVCWLRFALSCDFQKSWILFCSVLIWEINTLFLHKRIGQYLLPLSNMVTTHFKQIISMKGNWYCLPSLLKTNDHIILVNPVAYWVILSRFRYSIDLIRLWYESFCYIIKAIKIGKWFCWIDQISCLTISYDLFDCITFKLDMKWFSKLFGFDSVYLIYDYNRNRVLLSLYSVNDVDPVWVHNRISISIHDSFSNGC